MSAAKLQVWWFKLWLFRNVCGQITVLMFYSFVFLVCSWMSAAKRPINSSRWDVQISSGFWYLFIIFFNTKKWSVYYVRIRFLCSPKGGALQVPKNLDVCGQIASFYYKGGRLNQISAWRVFLWGGNRASPIKWIVNKFFPPRGGVFY